MKKRDRFSMLSKLGCLIIVFGFCMPVSCQMSGFQIASMEMQSNLVLDGVMLYLVFAGALLPLVIAIVLLVFGKKTAPIFIDLISLGISIISGIVALNKGFQQMQLQEGAYTIAIGWVISLLLLLIALFQKDSPHKGFPER